MPPSNLHIISPSFPLILLVLCVVLPPPMTALPSPSSDVVTVTAAPSIPSDSPQFVSPSLFASAILNSTNTYRAQHDAIPVVWNSTLARFATTYLTDTVTDACEFEHSGGPYGENLALGCTGEVTACVELWGDERENYDFGRGEYMEGTGHFTQLVWRNTSAVGCERRLCGARGWYLVCEYWPRGNVIGYFKEMVGEPVVEGMGLGSGATGKKGLVSLGLLPWMAVVAVGGLLVV